jgi:hypothetical protein
MSGKLWSPKGQRRLNNGWEKHERKTDMSTHFCKGKIDIPYSFLGRAMHPPGWHTGSRRPAFSPLVSASVLRMTTSARPQGPIPAPQFPTFSAFASLFSTRQLWFVQKKAGFRSQNFLKKKSCITFALICKIYSIMY